MRICKDHWAKMRVKVEALGLSQFVPGSGQEAMARTVRDLEAYQDGSKQLKTDWDPLSTMCWNFSGRVMEKIGLRIMMDRKDPDGMVENKDEEGFNHVCPLCIVRMDFDAHNTPTGVCGNPKCTIQVESGEQPWDENWIDSCGDAMLRHAVELKLVVMQ